MSEIGLAAANVSICHDKEANLRKFIGLMEEAARQGADLLVLPELGLQGYLDLSYSLGSPGMARQREYYFHESETIPGPSTLTLAQHAERLGICVQVGLAERALHGSVIYNSTALLGPAGLLGVYRKMHNQFEHPYFSPGEDTPVFDAGRAPVASVICYDICFPELPRSLALKGATVLLMSTAWPMRGHERGEDQYGRAMDLAAKAAAFFNQMWVVVSNHCERGVYSEKVDYYGGTQIVDPTGEVVGYLAQEEGLLVRRADVEGSVLKARTRSFFGLSLLQDRRPQHYGLIVDQGYTHPLNSTEGAVELGRGAAPSRGRALRGAGTRVSRARSTSRDDCEVARGDASVVR